MEKQIIYVDFTPGINPDKKIELLDEAFKDGWVLEPTVKSNPIKLEHVAIYHLIKFSEAENGVRLKAMDQRKPGAFDDVIDVKDVPSDGVASLVQAGWVMHKEWSKIIRMILRKKKETKHALVIPLKTIHLKMF